MGFPSLVSVAMMFSATSLPPFRRRKTDRQTDREIPTYRGARRCPISKATRQQRAKSGNSLPWGSGGMGETRIHFSFEASQPSPSSLHNSFKPSCVSTCVPSMCLLVCAPAIYFFCSPRIGGRGKPSSLSCATRAARRPPPPPAAGGTAPSRKRLAGRDLRGGFIPVRSGQAQVRSGRSGKTKLGKVRSGQVR